MCACVNVSLSFHMSKNTPQKCACMYVYAHFPWPCILMNKEQFRR